MKKVLFSVLALLFVATLISLANSAETETAVTTWAAIRDGKTGNGGTIKAAPTRGFGRKNIWEDGYVDADRPSRRGAAPQGGMQETLAEIGRLLDAGILAEMAKAKAGVNVRFEDLEGNPITSAPKGSQIMVFASHAGVDPFKGTCILLLPVTDPTYKETMLNIRQADFGVGAEWYDFSLPSWSQIGGTAIAIVSVQGAGTGFATLNVF